MRIVGISHNRKVFVDVWFFLGVGVGGAGGGGVTFHVDILSIIFNEPFPLQEDMHCWCYFLSKNGLD